MKKATPLTAGLVSTKGMALPSAIIQPQTGSGVKAATPGYFKSLTLKLDKVRYMQLKQNGLESGRSSQDILTAALDAYLGSLQNSGS